VFTKYAGSILLFREGLLISAVYLNITGQTAYIAFF